MSLHVEIDRDCLLLPAPYEVRREDRALRDDEYELYEQACLAACSELPARAIRHSVEEMYVFDWDLFDERAWATLRAAYESLPRWLAAGELPRWFGRDERRGPCLWASVEPPGLQVAGVLEQARFDEWHHRFLESTAKLPIRSIA